MAGLLQYGRHEEQHRRPEWMAVQKDTDVYLEAVETAQNEICDSGQAAGRSENSASYCIGKDSAKIIGQCILKHDKDFFSGRSSGRCLIAEIIDHCDQLFR